jgi:hypothetical protein
MFSPIIRCRLLDHEEENLLQGLEKGPPRLIPLKLENSSIVKSAKRVTPNSYLLFIPFCFEYIEYYHLKISNLFSNSTKFDCKICQIYGQNFEI